MEKKQIILKKYIKDYVLIYRYSQLNKNTYFTP